MPVIEPTLPALDAPLVIVSDGVAATADGWFVLADGSAVIGPDDRLVVGEQFTREDGVRVISTPYGEFQLLPRSLLITPFGQVLDLQAIRAELAAAAPSTTVAADTVDSTTARRRRRRPFPLSRRPLRALEADMRSHPFDPVSAALGLVAGAIGALVALGGTDSIDTGWWLALGALVLGLGLVPWTRGRRAVDGTSNRRRRPERSVATAVVTIRRHRRRAA